MSSRYRNMSNAEVDDVIALFRPPPPSKPLPPVGSCVSCHSVNVKVLQGAFICQDCDVVCGSYIDSLPEWRTTPQDGSKHMERCGVVGSDLYTESNLGCTMSTSRADQRMVVRLQSWSSMVPRDRLLYNRLSDMSRHTPRSCVPHAVFHMAQRFYKIVNDLPAAKGTRRAGLMEGAVYEAFRACGVSRSTAEIAALFDTPVEVVVKGCKRVSSYLLNSHECSRPQHFAMRFSADLMLDEASTRCVVPMIDAVERLGVLSESRPPTVAATCLAAIATTVGIPRRQVASVCKVAEATISKCARKIQPYLAALMEVAGLLQGTT
jgi:transcription initiation factor TFIIIB Brf1 subunit/transcription initiation factor TFIIB